MKQPTSNENNNHSSRSGENDKDKNRAKNHFLGASAWRSPAIIALLTIVILAFAIVYLQRLTTEVHTLDAALKQNQRQFDSYNADLADIKKNTATIQSQQEQQKKQLAQNSQQIANLRQMMPDISEDLDLSAIEQLIDIANLKLYWQRDIASSSQLLEIADQQIAKLDDPNLLPIRQEIAKKQNELQAIPQVDIDGLLSNLSAISEQIPKLALIKNQLPAIEQTTEQKEQPSATQANPEQNRPWQTMLTSSWQQLQKIIIVRHHDLTAQPLLPPKQSTYLIENIQLNLIKAQWAVLRFDQTVYDSSLNQTIDWIQTYFNNSNQAINIINTLKQLQTETLNPEIPNLNHLLILVQSSIKDRNTPPSQEDTTNSDIG